MNNPYHVKRTLNKLYLLKYCIILTTADDREIFNNQEVREQCMEYLHDMYRHWECADLDSYILSNALVMKFDAPPTLCPTAFINAFKQKSVMLLKETSAVWNTGYFITSMGGIEPEKDFFAFYAQLKRRRIK